MVNLLHLLNLRTRNVRRARRAPVPIPTGLPTTDAVFLLLRRMRMPFIVLVATFNFATLGMTLMPGKDDAGHTYYMTPFDAFYQMMMTVTTVGFSETPYTFSYPQRIWMTLAILMLVISWAYAIGVLFSMMQDSAFQEALATQRFRRRVAALHEPFMLVVGYGAAGQAVGSELDRRRRRFVVVESSSQRVEMAWTDELTADVPALEADGTVPAALGLAGLGSPHCEAVLALTDNDRANLAVVMSTSLLRPDLPVIARCVDSTLQNRIEDFAPTAVINPDDRYGGYLALSLHQPVTHQLVEWLMDNDEHELPRLREGLADGRWLVAGDCEFGEHVAADLRGAGLTVDQVPTDQVPDHFGDIAGFVAASTDDLTNIAVAERVRLAADDTFLCVRQRTNTYAALLAAMEIDSVYISTELVAREVLARVLTPVFWQYLEQVLQQDEQFAIGVRDRLIERVGKQAPERELITLDTTSAPAAVAWLQANPETLRLGDLMRHPDDRETRLELVPLMLIRDGSSILNPSDDTLMRADDQLLVAGSERGLSDVTDALFYTATLGYLVTGQNTPTTWVWRALQKRRADNRPSPAQKRR
ncbi:NAD-binding protein [Calidifontibacter terrae]